MVSIETFYSINFTILLSLGSILTYNSIPVKSSSCADKSFSA